MTGDPASARAVPDPPKLAWRLVRQPYADLSGEGTRRAGGRWNSRGTAVVYLAADAALSLLEVLVHLDLGPDLLPNDYLLMRVDLSLLSTTVAESWVEDGPRQPLEVPASRAVGDRWVADGRSLFLRVPSAIVPESELLLLNPRHALAGQLPRPTWRPFSFDRRLLTF